MKEKRKPGQPTKYRPDVHPEIVIKHGEQGHSESQMAKACGVARVTMRRWAEQHEEFRTALTRANSLAQAWWEETGQKAMHDKNFNANMYRIAVQARFKEDYTQTTKQEVTTKNADAPKDPRSVARALLTVLGEDGVKALGLGVSGNDNATPEPSEAVEPTHDTRSTCNEADVA